MITGRRSEEFHDLVEGGSTGGSHATTHAPLLDLVQGLRDIPAPVADPAFVSRLREQLLAEAAVVLVPATRSREVDDRLRLRPSTPRSRRRNRRLAAAVSGVALVGVTATMSVAAQSALPGDGLYPLKRTIESAHAELTFDRAAQGRVLLSSASTRLDEVAQLSRDNADPALVASTLNAFTDQAVAGSDLLVGDYESTGHQSSITTVRTFTATSMSRLHDLQSAVPPGSAGQLLQAAQALDQIEQVSIHTCSGCAGPAVTQVPTVLTDAIQAASATSLAPTAGQTGSHHSGPGFQLPVTGPTIPDLGGHLPPASVTDPGTTDGLGGTGTDATTNDVRTTIDGLTSGLTGGTQDTTTNVSNTTANLLDAVSQAGTDTTSTVGTVVGQVTGAVPTTLPTQLPTSSPTGLPTTLPSLP